MVGMALNDETDKELKNKATQLQALIVRYESMPASEVPPELPEEISDTMDDLANRHPNPDERKKWEKRAKKFRSGNAAGRHSVLKDVGIGLGIILATPFALAGAAIFAAGAIVYGAGTLVKGIGTALTFGAFEDDTPENSSSEAGER